MLDDLDEVMNPVRLEAGGQRVPQRSPGAPPADAVSAGRAMVLERGDGSIGPIAKLGEFKAEQVLARKGCQPCCSSMPDRTALGKAACGEALDDTTETRIDPDQIARTIEPRNPRSVDWQAGAAALVAFRQAIRAGHSLFDRDDLAQAARSLTG